MRIFTEMKSFEGTPLLCWDSWWDAQLVGNYEDCDGRKRLGMLFGLFSLKALYKREKWDREKLLKEREGGKMQHLLDAYPNTIKFPPTSHNTQFSHPQKTTFYFLFELWKLPIYHKILWSYRKPFEKKMKKEKRTTFLMCLNNFRFSRGPKEQNGKHKKRKENFFMGLLLLKLFI